MVAARRQRQAQKAQEQQISKALTDSKPASNHVSFGDDDEDDDQATRPASQALAANAVQRDAQSSNQDEEDDDAPIEVVSNKTSRQKASQDSAKLKAQEKAEKAQRQAAEKKRIEKQKQKDATSKKAEVPEPVVKSAEEASESEEDRAGPSNRLDPSLFAEVFARPVSAPRSILKRRSAEEEEDEVAKLQEERRLQRKKQRAGGVVKGRDGMPMKRTNDGTVLRALNTSSKPSANHKTSFDDQDVSEPEEPLDAVARPAPLDPSVSLPNAKARAFKKRTLTKKGSIKATPKGSNAKPKKSEDDPLGLNDPAFLPGGEFYHLVNKGDKTKGASQARQQEHPSARQAFRGGGIRKDAVSTLRARSRSGPSLGFARSQQDSGDDY